MGQANNFQRFADKMANAGIQQPAIQAFANSYRKLFDQQSGLIPENQIQPAGNLPLLEQIEAKEDKTLLRRTVVIKLNGGLGTGMGLEGPKSLLPVKDGLTFLDFIARQILFLRQAHREPLRFLLMNSFTTSKATLDFLSHYRDLGNPSDLELMQGQVPKVEAKTLEPISWPDNRLLEWCPPGHGDIYPSLIVSGLLEKLISEGVLYAFVSNSDNLGASLDLRMLSYFAGSGKSFVMEVTERTDADKKGGHLAKHHDGRFLLRELAQCPEKDLASFQDISRHRFFNTNNLWLRLDHLRDLLKKNGGIVPLPLIRNCKTVDPRNPESPAVFQLETAMGAAIEAFENAGAVNVPRTRFAPVKTTSDLLTLRSDACEVTDDWRVVLAKECDGKPPAIDLDSQHYKMVDRLDHFFQVLPSLKQCESLLVRGPVVFDEKTTFRGTVQISNPNECPERLKAGIYEDRIIAMMAKETATRE